MGKGKDVRQSNIVAAKAVANAIRTSLGPKGMDKLMELSNGEVLISNDGATILSKMDVQHPAAKMLVELSQSQDIEAGDGTTSVVGIAGALLESCSTLLSKGIHPTTIASSFVKASAMAQRISEDISVSIDLSDREKLISAVNTCLSSKVVAQQTDLLAPLAVDSVLGVIDPATATNVDLRDIRIVQQIGGTLDDTELVDGLVFSKGSTKSAGGPSQVSKAKIALIQFCLSAPKTDMDNNVVVSDYAAMDRILRDERKYILNQCKKIKKSGDVAMPGSGHKVVKFTGVQNPGKTMTILLRGSNDLVLAEADRSIHDAHCVVRSFVKKRYMIAGGGAPEIEVALRLKEEALAMTGMDAYCMKAYADALEVIPYTLAENAGMKPIHIVTELRKNHADGNTGAGIDVKKSCVSDMYASNVLQPLLVSTSAITLATETVCMILKVDDLIVVQ